MRTLIKISWRNIWRNRTRSLVIIATLILGLMGGVFSAAIRMAAEQQQFEETIENMISHMQIHHPEFIANPEARFRIPEGKAVLSELNRMEGIEFANPRTVLDGMAASANMNTGVRIKGIDPDSEKKTTKLNELLEDGTYFQENGRLPSIIIGRRFADKLNLDVGSRLVLTFQDIYSEVTSASFRVEGIYKVTASAFEERTVFVKADIINNLIGDDEAVNEIAVLINNPDNYREKAKLLEKTFPELKVRHWADMEPSLYYALEVLDQALIWLVAIIIFGVSFGLLNTILMSILERTKELGVLLAIGMKRLKVFSMVVVETLFISIIGGVIGLMLSYGMIRILNNTGVRIPGGEGVEEFGYASVLYPDLDQAFYFNIGIVVVIFAVLASIYPAWKAIKLAPAEAVRNE